MSTKKQVGLHIIKLLFIIAAASISELVLWNWSNWSFLMDDTAEKNVVYTMKDFQMQNWMKLNGQNTSCNDPILLREGIDGFVRQVRIVMDVDPQPPYIQVYYTNIAHPNYDGVAVVTAQPFYDDIVIDINDDIQNLRIDLGDDPGIVLRAITVTVNPLEIDFSVAIVVAVALIYLGGKFLFYLQRSPDYGLSDMSIKGEEDCSL